jgi:hypothetical protein
MEEIDTILIFADGQAPNTLHYLDFVITDDDLVIFYDYADEIKWLGYNDFLNYIQELQEKVTE